MQRDSAWWTERLARLRQGSRAGADAYDRARTELAEAATELARRSFPSLRRKLGEEFEDGLRDLLWGTGGRPKGLLEELERGEAVTFPVSFLRRSLFRGLVDVERRYKPPQEPPQEHEAPTESREPRSVGRLDPTALPAKVSEDFKDAAAFVSVALAVARGAPESPLGQLLAGRETVPFGHLRRWRTLSGFLEADVVRKTLRQRWVHAPEEDLSTWDLWARAWQAAYYKHEGETDYTDLAPGTPEIPANPKAAATFYQHAKRFRTAFQNAVRNGLGVVVAADGSVGNLPVYWHPATHQTLETR